MTTLTFQNTAMTVINQNNQIWFSITDIANALGYKETNGVTRLYNSHSDEFTSCMTALVDTQTNGGIQKVRIFSLRGTHLIGMLSHTKVAKDFRKWVLDILDKEVSAGTISPEQQQAIQSAVQQAHHRTGLHWQEIYRQIKAIFHVAKYDQLPADQFGNVMAFITNLQKIEQNLPLAQIEADQEAVQVITKLFHSLNGGYELASEIQRNQPHLARELEKQIGGHFIYNLQGPTRNSLDAARKFIQAKSERIAIVRGMASLLDGLPAPTSIAPARKQYGRTEF